MRYSVFALRATENAAVRRSWARDNGPKLEAYVRGYLAGLAWLYDPNNKEEAIAILRRNLPQMAPELAAKSYAMLVNPRGLTPKAKLDMEGVLAFGQIPFVTTEESGRT